MDNTMTMRGLRKCLAVLLIATSGWFPQRVLLDDVSLTDVATDGTDASDVRADAPDARDVLDETDTGHAADAIDAADASCDGGLMVCDGVCTDTNGDPNHCGSCGHAC